MTDELHALALEIADRDASCEIRSCCIRIDKDNTTWWEIDEQIWVRKAVRYLELRNNLVRHPSNSRLVRPKDWE